MTERLPVRHFGVPASQMARVKNVQSLPNGDSGRTFAAVESSISCARRNWVQSRPRGNLKLLTR